MQAARQRVLSGGEGGGGGRRFSARAHSKQAQHTCCVELVDGALPHHATFVQEDDAVDCRQQGARGASGMRGCRPCGEGRQARLPVQENGAIDCTRGKDSARGSRKQAAGDSHAPGSQHVQHGRRSVACATQSCRHGRRPLVAPPPRATSTSTACHATVTALAAPHPYPPARRMVLC